MTARAATALLAATLTVTAGAASAAAVPDRAPTSARTSRTTIVLLVKGCEGCHLSLVAVEEDGTTPSYEHDAVVRDGRVTTTTASSNTRRMAVYVDPPRYEPRAAAVRVAMRYRGQAVGSHVTFDEARSGKHAASCLSGTTASRLTIPVTVRKVDRPGGGAYALIWARTTQAVVPHYTSTDGGSLPSFDVSC